MVVRFFEDIEIFRRRDPAAAAALSIMINLPGMRTVWAYRRQHWLWTHGMRGLARALSTRSWRKFGVEIHPCATIGRRFMIDHGMGIVIGETTIISDDCMLYQGVTLGETGKGTGKRHPTLEDEVLVGVGASVLGNVTLGRGSKVGGGVVNVRDVPAYCTVVGIPGHVVSAHGRRVYVADGLREVYAEQGTAQEIDKKIEQYTHEKRRVFLPDPLDQTVNALAERVAVLEKRLIELEAATGSALSCAEPERAVKTDVASAHSENRSD